MSHGADPEMVVRTPNLPTALRQLWRVVFVNPFLPHFPSDGKSVYDGTLTSGNVPRDRSRTTIGRVWMCTMDNHRLVPTGRRPARFLGLGAAPKSMPDRHRETGW